MLLFVVCLWLDCCFWLVGGFVGFVFCLVLFVLWLVAVVNSFCCG